MPTMKKGSARRFYLAIFALFSTSCAHGQQSSSQPGADQEFCAIDPSTIVSDACASFSTLDNLNTVLKPFIADLTRDTDFFSYYRLNLFNSECPFWDDQSSTCGNIACAVTTIDNEEDIPEIWRAEELSKLKGPKAKHPDRKLQQETKPLMGELGADVGESCVVEYDDLCDDRDYCIPEDESSKSQGDYVSLVDNPERFTGYSGPGAHQVWEAIYRENCFSMESAGLPASAPDSSLKSPSRGLGKLQESRNELKQAFGEAVDDGECLEKRVFYRIISGMHASISTHLCYDYLNKTTGQWGPNLECYVSRLHEYPDRISNLYFNYALVLRAIEKVRPALAEYTFCSGDPMQDASTKKGVLRLADQISSGPRIYDESLMFTDSSADSTALKDDFRARFRNVSRAMDCVGCDKCRLWGKLQTAGYGMALKILFEFDDKDPSQNPSLRRTELVALVNTLDKLSHSLSALTEFEKMLNHKGLQHESPESVADSLESLADPNFEDYIKEQPLPAKSNKSEFRQDLEREISHIYRVMIWVLRRWLALPGRIWRLVLAELSHLWDVYLGKPGIRLTSMAWEFQYPPARDEI